MQNQTKMLIDWGEPISNVDNLELKTLVCVELAKKAVVDVASYETPLEGFTVRVSKSKQVTITVLKK